MKRYRNAVATFLVSPDTLVVPEPDYDVYSGSGISSSPNVIPFEITQTSEPVKVIAFIDPVISSPSSNVLAPVKPISEPDFAPMPTLLERITALIDPVVVTPSVQPEPIKEVYYIDPVISSPSSNVLAPVKPIIPVLPIEDEPITLNEANKSSDIPVATQTVVEKALETINKAVDEIFKTEVTKDNTVVKDNTGLYLAGAVVGLGVLALIFKK
jgi:hypothetical protein